MAQPFRCRRVLLASYDDVQLEPAVRAAGAISALRGASVEVVAAFEPPVAYPGASDLAGVEAPHVEPGDRPALDRQLARARRALNAAGSHAARWPLSCEIGQVPAGLARAAERQKADVTVVPLPDAAPGGGAIGRCAAAVALHASSPVLAVTPAWHDPPKRLLVAVDLDQGVVNAASVARALFPAPGEIELLHVAGEEAFVERTVHEQMDRVERALDPPADCRVERRIVRGSVPWRGIVAQVRSAGTDLIVGGLHGRSSTDRTLLRNTMLRLIAGAHCSVLVVPG